MLSHAVLLATLAVGGGNEKLAVCEPAECMRLISSKVTATLLDLPEPTLFGNWRYGGGLAGSDLYLFNDSTYVYTEWADVEPETIYDKGRWTLVAGLLTLSPDIDITWDPRSKRRYLTLRETDRTDLLLFGLDRTLEIFLSVVEHEPQSAQDYMRLSSLRKGKTWSRTAAPRVKSELMKRCWRPTYFAQ